MEKLILFYYQQYIGIIFMKKILLIEHITHYNQLEQYYEFFKKNLRYIPIQEEYILIH